MVERAPQSKRDEQYPLLKVDGGGDGSAPQVPSMALPWGVTCTPKQSWLVRWPEYVSACWMTFILLGISFLVFYALAMEAYRRQPVVIIKCNDSKTASDVYFHHIVSRGNSAPFLLYSEYLSNMASLYPLLHFHLIFLVDDSLQSAFRGPRHNRFINKMIPYTPYTASRLDENSNRELREFRRKYQNVNITMIPLSKYMATTPLKYKWRTIPLAYLPFYARVFSIWQNGGIGMDLTTFNDKFNNREFVDRRIDTILRQHNDGIKPEDYTNALNKIDREEESEIFSIFYGLIHQFLNETCTFLTKNFPFPQVTTDNNLSQNVPLVRTHRSKRELPDLKNSTEVQIKLINATNETDLKRDEYQTISSLESNSDKPEFINVFKFAPENNSITINNTIGSAFNRSGEALNKSDLPQVVLFYDFSIFSDGMVPPIFFPDAVQPSLRTKTKRSEFYQPIKSVDMISPRLMSIDSEGVFLSASSRLHPFLGYLITAGCQRMHPKFAIQDALVTQCSGMLREETYCNNIYLL